MDGSYRPHKVERFERIQTFAHDPRHGVARTWPYPRDSDRIGSKGGTVAMHGTVQHFPLQSQNQANADVFKLAGGREAVLRAEAPHHPPRPTGSLSNASRLFLRNRSVIRLPATWNNQAVTCSTGFIIRTLPRVRRRPSRRMS